MSTLSSQIRGRLALNKWQKYTQAKPLGVPKLLINQLQFANRDMTGVMFARHIPAHSHNASWGKGKWLSSSQKALTILSPNVASFAYGTQSPFSATRGTKQQMKKNLILMHKNAMQFAYENHLLGVDNLSKKPEENTELVTRSAFVEFSGHPHRRDGAFAEDEVQEVIAKLSEHYKAIVTAGDRNFIYVMTIPVLQSIKADPSQFNSKTTNLAYNCFYTFGQGIGLDFPTCIGNPERPTLQIIPFFKKSVSPIDITYDNTIQAIPPSGNPSIHPFSTNGGRIGLMANEVCLDHNMGHLMQTEFGTYMQQLALTDPHAFLYWMKNPIIFHDILSASVIPVPNHILSTAFALTDQNPSYQGVYQLNRINKFLTTTDRPMELRAALDWDARLGNHREEAITFESLPEVYGRSGMRMVMRSNQPITAPTISPAAKSIIAAVEKNSLATLDQAHREMAVVAKKRALPPAIANSDPSAASRPQLGPKK